MIDRGGGSFVNISSMNTVEPRAPYPMSMLRGALHSFSKLFGDRYARHTISMNNLMPGFCENVNLSEFARQSILAGVRHPSPRPARLASSSPRKGRGISPVRASCQTEA